MVIKENTLEKMSGVVSPTVSKEFGRWARYMYEHVRFNMPDSPIHAYGHCERVLLYSLMLCEKIYGDNREAMDILAAASTFHDSRRQYDYLDTGHGARAAVYYKEYCDSHPDLVYHEESAWLMRYHDLDDKVGIEAIKKHFGADAERVLKLYAIFKDADALDRWRLGSCGLDSRYLRLKESHELVDFARELVAATVDPELLADTDRQVKETMNKGKRLLLVIDPQVDFINGSLAVNGAERAMNELAGYIRNHKDRYAMIVMSADWHPYDHCSFADMGGMWPRHCVHDTVGAAIWPAVFSAAYETAGETVVLHKGERSDREEYSIFQNEDAAGVIADIVGSMGIREIDICGIAGDVCVLSSLKDGMEFLPSCRFRVLERYSPSIDGGKSLEDYVKCSDLMSE